uniref:Uncharacterized protein n=1 Tax=Anopheles farauti TaxID=69004 RepID=A0A182Q301_9DIPT
MTHAMLTLYLISFIGFLHIEHATGSVKMLAVGTKMEVKSHGKHLNGTCSFRPNSWLKNQTIDCYVDVLREIKELKLIVNYYVMALKNVVRTLLFTRSVDLCFFIRNPKSDRLVNIVYNYIRNRSNFPLRCPVPVGSYYILNMIISDVQIPAFLPETDFLLEEIFHSELLFYGKEVEFISHVNNIELTHTFHRRDSVTDQSLDFTVDITSPVRDMKVGTMQAALRSPHPNLIRPPFTLYSLKLQLNYYSVTGNGTVRNLLLKRAVDMCFYMQQPKSDRLVKLVYDYVRARTNLPMRCPIPAGNYYIRNIRPADVPVPAFLPEAEFILELIYRNEVRREKMVDFRFHGRLLIPVGSKVELISNVKTIIVAQDFQRQPVTNQSLNVYINVTRVIKEMKLSYYSVGANGTAQNTIFKRLVDLCFYIRNPSSDRVVRLVYDYVQERSNMPKRCPIHAGSYYMRDLRPADVPLPAFLPETSFILETIYRSEVRRETMVEFRFFVPVGTRIEFKSNINSIDVSHEFLDLSPINQTLHLYLNMSRPLKDMKLHFSYYSVGANGSAQNVIVKRLVDACFFISSPSSDRVVKMMYDYVQQRSNLPTRCPIPIGNYYIRNLRPNDVPVPSFLPEASFMLETNYRSEVRRKTIIEFRFYGKLVRFIGQFYYSVDENGSPQNVIMKRLVDACFFIRNPSSDRVVKQLYDYVQQHSNLPTRCPIPRGCYYILNLRPSDVPIPSFLPEVSFMLEINIRSEVRRETMLEFRLYGKLIRVMENIFAI